MSCVIWTPWAEADGRVSSAEKAVKFVKRSKGRATFKMRALSMEGLCGAGFWRSMGIFNHGCTRINTDKEFTYEGLYFDNKALVKIATKASRKS